MWICMRACTSMSVCLLMSMHVCVLMDISSEVYKLVETVMLLCLASLTV